MAWYATMSLKQMNIAKETVLIPNKQNRLLPNPNKSHLSRQKIVDLSDVVGITACRHCSNYIFILDSVTAGSNGLGRDNCNTRRKTFKSWDLGVGISACLVTSTPVLHWSTLFPTWIVNYIHDKVWDEIPFPNFRGAAIEVWEWISNFVSCFTGHMITYQCWDQS